MATTKYLCTKTGAFTTYDLSTIPELTRRTIFAMWHALLVRAPFCKNKRGDPAMRCLYYPERELAVFMLPL